MSHSVESVCTYCGVGCDITAVVSDNKISGDKVVLPTFDSNLNSEALFSGYRFSSASIQKV